MLKIGTLVLFLTGVVSFKANSESRHGEAADDQSHLNLYGDSLLYTGQEHRQTFARHDKHRPSLNERHNGNRDELTPGLGNYHGGNFHRGHRENRWPQYGGIVSQSQANVQSSGFGSQANSQSESQLFNGDSNSNSEAQAQSQGYQAYPFGPSGGGEPGASSASSASSAAAATAGIVNGVATASAAAAAASASSGSGGSSSSSSSSFSTARGNNNGGFGNGLNPSWFVRTRVTDQDGDINTANANAAAGASTGDDKLIFSQK